MAATRDLNGEVATYRNARRSAVTFCEVRLSIPRDRGWQAGGCRLRRADGGETAVDCAVLSAISAEGTRFPVIIEDGDGAPIGSFDAEGIVTGFPAGADCFLFNRDAHGYWDGVTLTASAGRATIVPFACDPA